MDAEKSHENNDGGRRASSSPFYQKKEDGTERIKWWRERLMDIVWRRLWMDMNYWPALFAVDMIFAGLSKIFVDEDDDDGVVSFWGIPVP